MKARILVIEDEMAINDLLCMNLEAAGYETVGYLDGNDASEGVAQDHEFQCALVDIMLPGKDGYTLLPELKKFGIPVIFLTAKAECMSNLVANEMYDPSGAGENAEESILAGIHKLQKASDDLVVVTNEVFSDSMTDNPEMEKYLKLLGNINLRMGEMADLVTEVVYGIPVERKDIKK